MKLEPSDQLNQITPKEVGMFYLELYKAELSANLFRVDYVWKINLGLWAALGLFLVSDYRNHAHISSWGVVIVLACLLIVYTVWGLQERQRRQQTSMRAYLCRQRAETVFGQPINVDSKRIVLLPISGRYSQFSLDFVVTAGLTVLNIINWLR
jgi:hypothetical protein